MAERQETSQPASRQLAESEESLQDPQPEMFAVTAEVNESHELSTEADKDLKVV